MNLHIDDSVFASRRWTSETQIRDGIEWRMDYRDGQLVQVLLRPEGDSQWRRPIEYLQAAPTGEDPQADREKVS